MRRAGKVSPLLLVAIAGIAALGILLFYGQEGPSAAASRFMDALARGDVDTLTQTSTANGKSPESLRKDWEFATKVAGQHYMFRWSITSSSIVDADDATVRLQVERNFGPSSYGENYGLPMRKIDGKWKVEASGISREMYPGLPKTGADVAPSATK